MQMNRQQSKTPVIPYAIMIGFFAGLIWGALRLVYAYFHFSKLDPAFMAEPFFLNRFLKSNVGWLVGLGCFIIFSIVASIIYAWLLRKRKGPWLGLFYGLSWWLLLFVILGPLLHWIRPFTGWDSNTMLAEGCLFLLWGLFIGYSISFEFTDERKRLS
jgi:hypothetical protein